MTKGTKKRFIVGGARLEVAYFMYRFRISNTGLR